MIKKTQIQKNLDQIERLHNKYMADKRGSYFSKLAIIEVCGWIEESIDDIVRECAKKYLKQPKNLRFVEVPLKIPIVSNTIHISEICSYKY